MGAVKTLILYYENALALGLAVRYSPEIETVDIQLGKHNYYFIAAITPFNNVASSFLAKNKYSLNKTLERAGFPVPKAIAINKDAFMNHALSDLLQDLNFPLVVKPMQNTSHGRDVLCNIKDLNELSTYLTQCFEYYFAMQIEEFHGDLKEYRVLIFRNRVMGVVERFAAKIVGDGQHTITELIDLANEERARKCQERVYMTHRPIMMDTEIENCLREQALSVQSVVPKGKTIQLCYTVNTWRGGDILSHGKRIHPLNAKLLCQVARQAGLNYVGLDVRCEDINLAFSKSKWLILEANFNPDITIHVVPSEGKAVNVTKKVLKHLIYRHPFAYLCHRLKVRQFSIYSKMIVIIGVLLLVIAVMDL